MAKLEELKEMLCEELDKITKKGELSAGSLDVIDKLTHSIKSIDTIMAMGEDGYSSAYSYARGRGRNARRDSMGRYSRESEGGNSYARGRSGRYSYDDAMDELKEHLEEMERMVTDPESKRMIQKWMKQVD